MVARIRKARWPESGLLQFPRGLDTYHVAGNIYSDSLQVAENVEMPLAGVVQTRRGSTLYLTCPDDTKPIQGMYELALVSGTVLLLVVQEGKLYKKVSTSLVQIPIRLSTPYACFGDNSTFGERLNGVVLNGAAERASGSVGANLVGSKTYQWALLAVRGAGKTTLGDAAQFTTGATPHPVDLKFHGVYKADTYELWRRMSSDAGVTWGSWGKMVTGLTHTTSYGKTLVSWADDGNTAPDTSSPPPSSNTTEHTLPTTTRVDFDTWDSSWNAENACYFCNGDGICRTDGTSAEIVAPTSPKTYLESAAGINAYGDVTWAGHTARGIIRHLDYFFFGDYAASPNIFHWTRANDPSHVPQTAAMQVPAHGGRVLDFRVKDAQLCVGTNTGFWALVGTNFRTVPPAGDVYFSEATDTGVATEWSMVRAPHGWMQWIGVDKRLYAMTNLYPDKERTNVFEVAEAIGPTLEGMTDSDNSSAIWSDNAWLIAYPGDQKMISVYERQSADGFAVTPVIQTGVSYSHLLRRRDGTVLAAQSDAGYIYQIKTENNFADEGTAYTMRIKTQKLDAGVIGRTKKWRWVRVYYDCPNPVDLTYRLETEEGVVSGTETLYGAVGYDQGVYDDSTYDPWNSPYFEIDFGEEGPQIQVTLSTTGYIRIFGLLFEVDVKR